MTRYIDADALKLTGCCVTNNDGSTTVKAAVMEEDIDNAPTIDAEPVIRCRDCKFLRLTGTVWRCQNRLVMMLCDSNDFCSRAEPKVTE